jgi:hypothetical protein
MSVVLLKAVDGTWLEGEDKLKQVLGGVHRTGKFVHVCEDAKKPLLDGAAGQAYTGAS